MIHDFLNNSIPASPSVGWLQRRVWVWKRLEDKQLRSREMQTGSSAAIVEENRSRESAIGEKWRWCRRNTIYPNKIDGFLFQLKSPSSIGWDTLICDPYLIQGRNFSWVPVYCAGCVFLNAANIPTSLPIYFCEALVLNPWFIAESWQKQANTIAHRVTTLLPTSPTRIPKRFDAHTTSECLVFHGYDLFIVQVLYASRTSVGHPKLLFSMILCALINRTSSATASRMCSSHTLHADEHPVTTERVFPTSRMQLTSQTSSRSVVWSNPCEAYSIVFPIPNHSFVVLRCILALITSVLLHPGRIPVSYKLEFSDLVRLNNVTTHHFSTVLHSSCSVYL